MNSKVSIRACDQYDIKLIKLAIADIYANTEGPSLKGKTVLIKPNILSDTLPDKAISTHPAFVEAVIEFVKDNGATKIMVGESPAMHGSHFEPKESQIYEVCLRTGAQWCYFAQNSISIQLKDGHSVKVANEYNKADIIISLPKLKTHGLMVFTGAIKNTFGFIPALQKTKQHAQYNTNLKFAEFLLNLNDAIKIDYVFMDGIVGMEGAGPANGIPIKIGAILGSSNILALDIIAASICGYKPNDVPANMLGLKQGKYLKNADEIIYEGPNIGTFIKEDFKKVKNTSIRNIVIDFVKNHVPILKLMDKRPCFVSEHCIACGACIRICPAQTIKLSENKPHTIILKDKHCIRCFCCHEVCPKNAIEIKRYLW